QRRHLPRLAGWLINDLQLNPVYADTPPAGGLIEHAAQLAVDLVPAGERLLQVHRADDVADGGRGELFDGLGVVGDLIGGGLGIGDREVHHRVDVDYQVVRVDHRLRLEGHHPLTQVHPGAHPVHEWDQEVQPRVHG